MFNFALESYNYKINQFYFKKCCQRFNQFKLKLTSQRLVTLPQFLSDRIVNSTEWPPPYPPFS